MEQGIKVTIKGVSPLLMNRLSAETEEGMGKPKPTTKVYKAEEEAEDRAYRDRNGQLYQPGLHLQRALVTVAGGHKIGKKGAGRYVAAGLRIAEAMIPHGTDKYEIDSQSAIIRATKGRVMRHRPRLNDWELSFTVVYDDDKLTPEFINSLLVECGKINGLGDFRPQKSGSYGKFIVTKFEPEKEPARTRSR